MRRSRQNSRLISVSSLAKNPPETWPSREEEGGREQGPGRSNHAHLDLLRRNLCVTPAASAMGSLRAQGATPMPQVCFGRPAASGTRPPPREGVELPAGEPSRTGIEKWARGLIPDDSALSR